MDQATLGLTDFVPCETMGGVMVHYSRREEPHSRYQFPVVCKLDGGPVVIAWVYPHVRDLFHLKLRSAGIPSQVARLEWIAVVDFVELL
jgi:hypothetical protein